MILIIPINTTAPVWLQIHTFKYPVALQFHGFFVLGHFCLYFRVDGIEADRKHGDGERERGGGGIDKQKRSLVRVEPEMLRLRAMRGNLSAIKALHSPIALTQLSSIWHSQRRSSSREQPRRWCRCSIRSNLVTCTTHQGVCFFSYISDSVFSAFSNCIFSPPDF